MLSTEVSPARPPAPPVLTRGCPRCFSNQIEPVTPIPNANIREAAEAVWSDCWAGQGALATRFVLRWVCVGTANALRDKFRCLHCGFSFREDRP